MDLAPPRSSALLAATLVAIAGCAAPPLTGQDGDEDGDDGRDDAAAEDAMDDSEESDGAGEGDDDDEGDGAADEEEAFAAGEWRRRIEAALAPVDCPLPPERTYNSSYYQGPIIDSHLHLPQLPDSPADGPPEEEQMQPIAGVNVRMDDIACTLAWEGTRSAISFFPVFPHIDWQSLEVVNRTMALYPDTFIPFIMAPAANDDPPSVDEGPLRAMLGVYPGLFRGYGEIGLYPRSEGGRGFPPDDPVLERVYPVLREHRLTAYFHPDHGQTASLDRVLSENPDINFIVHGEGIETTIGSLMTNHSNVFFTANDLYGDQYLLHRHETTESFLEKTADYEPLLERDLATWKAVIEAHPDQFMWGTDRGGIALWTLDREVGERLNDYGRAFIARLDPAVQERFAYKNVERAMGEGFAGP